MHSVSPVPRPPTSLPTIGGLLGESTIPLQDVPAHLPSRGPNGRRTHHSTCLRWVLRGVRGVKLEAVRMGGRWMTSLEALDRFTVRVTAAVSPEGTVPASAATDSRREEAVTRELDAAGW